MSQQPSSLTPRPKRAQRRLEKAAKRPARRKIQKSRRKRIWLSILYGFLSLLVIFAIAAIALYFNRNLAYETVIKRMLADRGYDAALTIRSADTRQAIIENLALGQNGKVFASADVITATYEWEALRAGKIEGLDVAGLTLDVEIDEAGKILSDWFPKSSGDTPVAFPPKGIVLQDASIDLLSPYGEAIIKGDLDLRALDEFNASFQFDSERLTAAGYHAGVQGKIRAQGSGSAIDLTGTEIDLSEISVPKGEQGLGVLGNANAKLSGTLMRPFETSDVFRYDGKANVTATNFDGPYFSSQSAVLAFDGQAGFNPQNQTVTPSEFAVQASLKDLSLNDQSLRRSLSKRVTLNETLTKAPVAGPFAGSFTKDVEDLLEEADWDGRLGVSYHEDGYSVRLLSAVRAKNQTKQISLRQHAKQPAFTFDKASRALTLRGDIDIKGTRDLKLDNLVLMGESQSGYLWSSIETVSGRAVTDQTWQSGDVKLSPFDAALNYAKAAAQSRISLTSNLEYDGPLIGMNFKGLKANGKLDLTSRLNGTSLWFHSRDMIMADRVETGLGYVAENLSLRLASVDTPILKRKGGETFISLSASNVDSKVISDDQSQAFAVKSQTAKIEGRRSTSDELWTVNANDALITSQTTPGENTRVKSPEIKLRFDRQLGEIWNYGVAANSARAKFGPVSLGQMDIGVSGAGSGFEFSYDGGTVLLAGSNLPALPVNGSGAMRGGRIEGKAVTALPDAPQFPINADYYFENGQGGAILDISQFIFAPAGVQPQDLAPALRGKVASVEGLASAKVSLGYVPGKPITSKGTVTLTNMDIGTLVGPFMGVSADLTFDSLYPLRSSGPQTVKMTGFNPGLPLGGGEVTFEVVKGGFNLIEAVWPMGSGEIAAMPTFWSTAGDPNRVTIKVSDISLGDLVAGIGNEDLSATGQINGTLPVLVDGVKLVVENGRVEIADGGVITVKSRGLDAAGERNEVAKLAVDALKEFHYDELSLDINGPLDGNITLGAKFTGSNPEVLGGADFLFRTTIEGELVNIVRNLQSGTQMNRIKKTIEDKAVIMP